MDQENDASFDLEVLKIQTRSVRRHRTEKKKKVRLTKSKKEESTD